MYINNGVDIIEIERVEKVLQKKGFIPKFFSEKEAELFAQKGAAAPQTVAANFAAKEAFSKAMGTGFREYSLRDVAVLRDELGAPYFELSGAAKELAELYRLKFTVSLSHSRELAIAFVTAYREED